MAQEQKVIVIRPHDIAAVAELNALLEGEWVIIGNLVAGADVHYTLIKEED